MSQSLVKRPTNGPHSTLFGLGVLASEQPPCTVCALLPSEHGTYPTCATHPYTPDAMCQHVLGAACLGRECQRGCVRARGVRALESGRHQVFTDDEVEEFYEEWEFNEADPGRIEFRHLVREIEHRLLKRIDGVTRLAADTFPAQDADGKESTHG